MPDHVTFTKPVPNALNKPDAQRDADSVPEHHSHTLRLPFTEPTERITFTHSHPEPDFNPHVHRLWNTTGPALYPADR
jgi:hypothetical protein